MKKNEQKNSQTRERKRSDRVERQHLVKHRFQNTNAHIFRYSASMNTESKPPPPSTATADEAISLMEDNIPSPLTNRQYEDNEKHKSQVMTIHKAAIQHRLMRWCALLLALGTLVIIWRFVSILILAIWLSSICRPLLEWLVNHL